MNQFLLLGLMFCGGIMVALQPAINGRLAQKVGVIESSFISFAVGTIALMALVLITGKGSLRAVSTVPWWELTGGLMGAFFVTATIIVVPRIGTAATMAAIIVAQLSTGLLLDHYGLMSLRQIPLDSKRVLGVALLLAGVALIVRK